MSFKIIHDLSTLNDLQIQHYLENYSDYLGLNPAENRIDVIWMNTDSIRTRVAYCRRGTTDLLREIRGISIDKLVREDGPGFVAYQAIGHNRQGRQEIAVGAYTTLGLTGDRLAAAIATAQTRALRRLTLQFVGGGLLDESEVNSQPIATTPSLLATPAIQPEVKPNVEVGKPIMLVDVPGSAIEVAESVVKNWKSYPEHHVATLPPAPEPLSEPAPVALMAVPANIEAANAILQANAPEVPTKPEKKPRKPRKSKNAVDMGDPQPLVEPTSNPTARTVEHEIDMAKIAARPNTPLACDNPKSVKADILESKPTATPAVLTPVCPICEKMMAVDDRLDMFLCVKDGKVGNIRPSQMAKDVRTPEPAPVPTIPTPPPPKTISVLTEDEQKQVKARLAPFWLDILPKGGMTANDGLSIWAKLIKFTEKFYEQVPNYKTWNFAQWEAFFDYLEEMNTKLGAAALVEQINSGVK